MTDTQRFIQVINSGDVSAASRFLDANPSLAHARLVEPQADGTVPRGTDCATALQTAATSGNLDMVRLLIERGAEIYETAQWGYPAIEHAYWKDHKHVVDYFLNEAAKHPTMASAPTYGIGCDVNLAARNGWGDRVKAHLARDPLAVHRRGVIGETCLHWAGHNGHTEIVEALFAAGADVNADEIGCYGGKPLHWAAEHQPHIVRILLEHGAEVNGRNILRGAGYEGFTPLLWLASQKEDCIECAQLLHAAGADLRAVDVKNRTALHWARERGATRVAEFLEQHGLHETEIV